MSIDNLNLELSSLHTPEQVKHLFPGNNAKRVREMCATGELGHTLAPGPGGMPRYYISDNDIRNWRRKHQQRAS